MPAPPRGSDPLAAMVGHAGAPNRIAHQKAAHRLAVGGLRVVLLSTCVVLAGCGVLDLRREAAGAKAATLLLGQVHCAANKPADVVVAVFDLDKPATPAVHHVRLHACGGFELVVPPGRYGAAAFLDLNGNGRLDLHEPVAEYAGPIQTAGGGIRPVGKIDLSLHAVNAPNASDRAVRALSGLAQLPHSTQAGAMLDLDALHFGAGQGERGYWAPMEFMRAHGANIYFLEPYDPGRTPVLLVHGAAGSPQDWRAFIDRLDRSRYQAWVAFYPSGASIELSAELLHRKLQGLQQRYAYESLVVTAHSAGGLVARSLLARGPGSDLRVRLFISLSTPWGGEASADLGVRHSPAVVPSWHDMRPAGEFLRSLYERPLPPCTRYILLFGHRGRFSIARGNTDETVTLASMLRPEAQREASIVSGFDEDHMSILAAPAVWEMYRGLIDLPRDAGMSDRFPWCHRGASAGGVVMTHSPR